MLKVMMLKTGGSVLGQVDDDFDFGEAMVHAEENPAITITGCITINSNKEGMVQITPMVFGADKKGATTIPVDLILAVATPSDDFVNMYNQHVGSGITLVRSMPGDLTGGGKPN